MLTFAAAGFGYPAGLRFLIGLFIGTNLVTVAVISGLAAVLMSVPIVRIVLLAASPGYPLYLAARIALSGSRLATHHSTSSRFGTQQIHASQVDAWA